MTDNKWNDIICPITNINWVSQHSKLIFLYRSSQTFYNMDESIIKSNLNKLDICTNEHKLQIDGIFIMKNQHSKNYWNKKTKKTFKNYVECIYKKNLGI